MALLLPRERGHHVRKESTLIWKVIGGGRGGGGDGIIRLIVGSLCRRLFGAIKGQAGSDPF